MTDKSIVLVLALLFGTGFAAGAPAIGEENWLRIYEDTNGQGFMDTASLSRPAEGVIRVTMKFEGDKGNSPMYFLDEIDCEHSLIRRLAVDIHKPTCAGEGEPIYHMEYEGRWDRFSSGLEEHLKEAICQ